MGRTKRHLQQLCAAVPHHKQHNQRDFYLSFLQVSYLETSDRGHTHPVPDVHQLLLKSQTISPPLALRPSASDGQQDQLAALLPKLPVIEVYNFPTGHCCLRHLSLPVPAAPESHCCYGELYISPCWNHSPSILGLRGLQIKKPSPLVPFAWHQIHPAGSSWGRKSLITKRKKKYMAVKLKENNNKGGAGD